MSDGKQYVFDDFSLDAREGVLRRAGVALALTPKAFETLLLLVERNHHIVTKDEMMSRVWADSFVEENNLSQNISLLRKLIGAHYIETVPKRGYRLNANVTLLAKAHEPSVSHAALTYSSSLLSSSGVATTTVPANDVSFSPNKASLGISTDFVPETHYARSDDGVHIAYQVVGSGAVDVVFVMGWVSHLEYFWREPRFAGFLRRLAAASRLILFDKRGTGLSDRVPLDKLPTLEQRMDDVRAVLEAVGSERAVLFGVSEGGPMSCLFAATYPEMTTALIMFGTYAKRLWSKDYPFAPTLEEREKFYVLMERDWGGAVGIEDRAPSLKDDADFRQWWATYLRMGASPGAALALTKMNAEIDVRSVLPSIRVPTLVLHRRADACLRVEEGRYVAARIPHARFVELDGADHLPFVGDAGAVLSEIEQFLCEVTPRTQPDRLLATILSARLKGATDGATADEKNRLADVETSLADKALPDDEQQVFSNIVQEEINRYRGRIVSATTHEVCAAFDGPARAIRVARALVKLNSNFACGLHTGECDVVRHAPLGGQAVELAHRVADVATASQVLVSSTVRDLVAGAGITFQPHGTLHVDESMIERQLYAVNLDSLADE